MNKLCCFTVAALAVLCSAASGQQGIPIVPGEDSTFTYADDFETPKCLKDAFLSNTGVEVWTKGSLQTRGPARRRTLTYRFHGNRVITGVAVTVEQRANARNLGGQTRLSLSTNGLDWGLVADSKAQPDDTNGWQNRPFTLTEDQAQAFAGETEVWLQLVMDNYSGLKTYVSNIVQSLEVGLELGDEAGPAEDPQGKLRSAWGEQRRAGGWAELSLDAADPVGTRAPHYYEDADGWLQAPGEAPCLVTEEATGFRVQRKYLHENRSPLSLAMFPRIGTEGGPLMARVTILATRDGSRRAQIRWDGRRAARFDAASFFDKEKVIFAQLRPRGPGVHELRIVPEDQGAVTVHEIALIGPRGLAWSERPAVPHADSLQVLTAEYLPDPAPPPASQAVEGRHAKQDAGLVLASLQRLYQEHDQFGALRVTLRNPGRASVRIRDRLVLNGKPVEDSYVDFVTSEWDARGVVWHRVRPQLVRAGECCEVYIRFRRRPTGDAARITIPCENASAVKLTVPYTPPAVVVDYVTIDKSGNSLYAYLRRVGSTPPGKLTGIALDGRPLGAVKVYGADFGDGVALAVARLPRALQDMSFHVLSAITTAGATAGAQFRVLPWFLPRSSIHVPSSLCEEMNMNLGMWHFRSEQECRQYGIPTSTNTHRMFDAHAQVRYILGPDEPDAKDNRGGGYGRGLGSHARRLRASGWSQLVASQAPHVATWIIMNGTTRPLNWCVYGQFADIACFDPYPINFYGGDHAYVRESLSYARQCGLPRRMYACLEAFGWSAGQGVPSNRRGPIPGEWRQNMVQAIGSGAKGFTSWVYSAGAGGWQINEAAKHEIARVNALVTHIEDQLLLGTPVDWARTDAGTVPTGTVGEEKWPKERVWAGALLCGPDAIVVAAANHIPAAKPDPPTITPAEDVTLTVRLPGFLREVSAAEVTDDGLKAVPCTIQDGQARLAIGDIETGRVFLLQRK